MILKRGIVWGLVSFFAFSSATAQYNWQVLPNSPTAPTTKKQDDIYFVNANTGWSINGEGNIYKTTDGGNTWTNQINKPGTYFRCVGFIDSLTGFAGNIGVDIYPGVSDTIPLYKTIDGGLHWSEVTNINGPMVKGLCAINVVDRNVVYAGGRVGGPAFIIKSADGGNTWNSKDMSSYCSMILDMKFLSADTGFIFAGTDANIANSHAVVLYTTDGGQTFTPVYTSSRLNEICWKGCMVTKKVGYFTILSYDITDQQRYVAKTTDGGQNWIELPLANNGTKEFGIGFLTENAGWVGTDNKGFETTDGGNSWQQKNIGDYANKIRLLYTDGGYVGYAIGAKVYKMNGKWPTGIGSIENTINNVIIYPNPTDNEIHFAVNEESYIGSFQLTIHDMSGKLLLKQNTLTFKHIDNHYEGSVKTNMLSPGIYKCGIKYLDKYFTKMITIK